MFRYRKLRSPIKRVLMLITIPLVLTSTGYALFSQQLTLNATATNPVYTSSQNLLATYDRSVTPSGQNWLYDISVTITNNGSRTTSAWQSTFDLPSDYSNLSCTNAVCSQASMTNTAVNTGSNGTITAGGTVSYSFTFTSSAQNFRFGTISVSGTLVPIYQTVSGLTVFASAGTRTQSGGWYTWPITITVTNASGQNLDGWRVVIPWDTATNQIESMPGTVDYVESSTQLTILSKQAINTGTNFQFVADLSSTSPTWTMTGYTVEGQF